MTVTVKQADIPKFIDYNDLKVGTWFMYQKTLYLVSEITSEKSLSSDIDQKVIYVLQFGDFGYQGMYKATKHWTFQMVDVDITWRVT